MAATVAAIVAAAAAAAALIPLRRLLVVLPNAPGLVGRVVVVVAAAVRFGFAVLRGQGALLAAATALAQAGVMGLSARGRGQGRPRRSLRSASAARHALHIKNVFLSVLLRPEQEPAPRTAIRFLGVLQTNMSIAAVRVAEHGPAARHWARELLLAAAPRGSIVGHRGGG
jgi:hypothetical protein